MYPAEDLKRLELRKLRARLSILAHRQKCAAAGRQIDETVQTLEHWRRQAMHWSSLLKFAPGIWGILRGLRGLAPRRHSASAEADAPKRGKVATALRWMATGLKAYNTFRARR